MRKFPLIAVLFFIHFHAESSVQVGSSLSHPEIPWTVIAFPQTRADYFGDQQTGSSSSDIVGDARHPAFYKAFSDKGTPETTDDELAFRIRLAGSDQRKGQALAFDNFLFIGVDAGEDPAGPADLDLFIGYDAKDNKNPAIAIHAPGSGSNTSPSTTIIGDRIDQSATGGPVVPDPLTPLNNEWARVQDRRGPHSQEGTNNNLDGGRSKNNFDANDYFLTFKISYAEMLSALNNLGIAANAASSFSFVVGTSEQSNAFNQDLNGIEEGTKSDLTWDVLGALSEEYTADGLAPVLEPGLSGMVIGLGVFGFCYFRRRG